MQDEQRADLLYSMLTEDAPQPAVDDEELDALAALGVEIERLGPHLAMIARADEAFDAAFAGRLRGALLEAHPATPAVKAIPAHAAPAVVRRLSRRVGTLLV